MNTADLRRAVGSRHPDYYFFDPTTLDIEKAHEILPEPSSPDQILTHTLTLPPGRPTGDMIILIPAWHNGSPAYEQGQRRLAKMGHTVLAFYTSDDILSADYERTLAYQKLAAEQTASTVERVKADVKPSRTVLMPASLGNTWGTLAMSKGLEVDSAVLWVPGDELASCLWTGARTQHLKRAIEAHEPTLMLSDLRSVWRELAPIRYTRHLRKKPVDIHLSRDDVVIKYERGKQLANQLEKDGAELRVHTNSHLGHYLTVGLYYRFGYEHR